MTRADASSDDDLDSWEEIDGNCLKDFEKEGQLKSKIKVMVEVIAKSLCVTLYCFFRNLNWMKNGFHGMIKYFHPLFLKNV